MRLGHVILFCSTCIHFKEIMDLQANTPLHKKLLKTIDFKRLGAALGQIFFFWGGGLFV